jgi:hypothetical protein
MQGRACAPARKGKTMETRVISEGPAVVSWNGQNYYTEGAVTLTPDIKLREMVSAYHGPVDQRVTDKLFNLSFTPFGEMDGNAAKYFPFAAADIGKLVAPAADTPLVIYASTGEKISFPAGCISKCPQLLIGTDKGPMGDMSFAAMGDITAEDAADDTHYTVGTEAIAAHTLNPDRAPTPAYKATLGDGGSAVEIDGEEGFTFDAGATLTPRAVNRYGTVNFKLTALAPSISFRLFGPANAGDKGIAVTFADCFVKSGSMLFSATDPRHGEYAFVPALRLVSGVPQALYTMAFPAWA